jgi:diaminohydroxyphosphoribosylaminopyrimidine deaminase/5-amino-6-(5-phosphoribosylamino)uracil reductase
MMRRALELAERGNGMVSPNPLVGCIITSRGHVIAEGWHRGPGTDHAEVAALSAAGGAARNATVYTSLEPCDRFGRTPPCTRALISAGVSRVVVGAADPNLGEGSPGISELRTAGIDVTVGVLARESERQNRAFLSHVRTGLPFVMLKMAVTLDGRSAAKDGSSKWISGEASRADVQQLRTWADAVVAGAGTVLTDDPSLTVRELPEGARPALRVVVDSTGRVPADRRVFYPNAPTMVATSDVADPQRIEEWREAGAEVVFLDRDQEGRVSMRSLIRELGKRDVQGVLIEGGPSLAWSAIRDGVVDGLVYYIAPLLIGGDDAKGSVGGGGFAPIAKALPLRFTSVERLGDDIKVEADVHWDR